MIEAAKKWVGLVARFNYPLRAFLGASEHTAVFLTQLGLDPEQKAAIKIIPADAPNARIQLSRWERAAKLPHFRLLRLFETGECTLDGTRVGRSSPNVNRFYDVLAPETDFSAAEEFVVSFALSLDPSRPYTTREYFYLLGRALAPAAQQEGILTAAAKHGVPVYSPALGDSVHGLAIASGRVRAGQAPGQRLLFDIIGDVLETAHIAVSAQGTGVIYMGGGTPKNFIQQAEVASYIYSRDLPGHKYGIQITMDQPQWGGLSGCTFEEAQSWRKIAPDANTVTVNVEATVALPLIVSALAEASADAIKNRRRPTITFEGMPSR